MGFKNNLKEQLSLNEMLVKELSLKSGVSKHTIDNYLNVRSCEPSAEAAVKIARALGVSVEYLVTGKDEKEWFHFLSRESRHIFQSLEELPHDDRKIVVNVVKNLTNGLKTKNSSTYP